MKRKSISLRSVALILLSSFALWYIMRYNEVYETRQVVNFSITNVPENITLDGDKLPAQAELVLQGKGLYLHWFKMTGSTVKVDYNKLVAKNEDYLFSISGDDFKIGNRIDVRSPQNIDIDLSDVFIVEKKVALAPLFNLIITPDFEVSDSIGFVPDSVLISGSHDKISALDKVLVDSDVVIVAKPETVINFNASDLENKFVIVLDKGITYQILATEFVKKNLQIKSDFVSGKSSESIEQLLSIAIRTPKISSDSISEKDFNIKWRKERRDSVTVMFPEVTAVDTAISVLSVLPDSLLFVNDD